MWVSFLIIKDYCSLTNKLNHFSFIFSIIADYTTYLYYIYNLFRMWSSWTHKLYQWHSGIVPPKFYQPMFWVRLATMFFFFHATYFRFILYLHLFRLICSKYWSFLHLTVTTNSYSFLIPRNTSVVMLIYTKTCPF